MEGEREWDGEKRRKGEGGKERERKSEREREKQRNSHFSNTFIIGSSPSTTKVEHS
jgi:hypothetical protein